MLAARSFGARTFLHESNTIPGRANRWLSWTVNRAFVGFEETGPRLHTRNVSRTGTPVRPQFQPRSASEARTLLGLDPLRPVLLVMGGSQGASGINQLVIDALASLRESETGAAVAAPDRHERCRKSPSSVRGVRNHGRRAPFLVAKWNWRSARRRSRSAGPVRRRWPNWRPCGCRRC